MVNNQTIATIQHQQASEQKNSQAATYTTYKYRWVILSLFFLLSLSSAFQWPTYVIIGNVIERYYGKTIQTINLTATVFLLGYVTFIVPATFMLQRFGIKFAILVAATGPCIASIIKLYSVQGDRFWTVLLAQAVVGTTHTYVAVLPATIAAAWFAENQVSTACSVATAGIQVSIAIGTVVPTLLVDEKSKTGQVETALWKFNMGVAVFACTVLVLIILFFKSDPPSPPSETRLRLKETKVDIFKSIKEMLSNKAFLLFWLAYSFSVGVFYAMCFLINPTVLKHYPNNISDVGVVGILFISCGVVGAGLFGALLDKFRRFKLTALVVHILSSISIVVFSAILQQGIIYVYIFQTLFGFFIISAVPVGIEVGAEITYPIPENISSGFLLIGTKLFGFVLTSAFTALFSNGFGVWTQFGMASVVVFSTILMAFTPFELNRQAVHLHAKDKNGA